MVIGPFSMSYLNGKRQLENYHLFNTISGKFLLNFVKHWLLQDNDKSDLSACLYWVEKVT
jgi:hypothetical protein